MGREVYSFSLTPSMLISSVNAVELGPRVLAHRAISHSIFEQNGLYGFPVFPICAVYAVLSSVQFEFGYVLPAVLFPLLNLIMCSFLPSSVSAPPRIQKAPTEPVSWEE